MMNRSGPRIHQLLETHRKLAVDNLKRCPVCSTVNAKLNHECFVCRWHGGFDHDPHSVEEGLVDILEQCPELVDCILTMPSKPSFVERASSWLKRRFGRRMDLRV